MYTIRPWLPPPSIYLPLVIIYANTKICKVSAIKIGHTLFYCFLLDKTLNFEAFSTKIGMYVYF